MGTSRERWKSMLGLVIAAALAIVSGEDFMIHRCNSENYENNTIYDFNMTDIYENKTISLADYQGKVLIVVNVATY
ncbi:hypothetical protein CHUAL_002444 [Chamberlinius hualienensis]